MEKNKKFFIHTSSELYYNRSLPGLKNTAAINAGWSSLVARQAHNLKVAGSNPAPATKIIKSLVMKINVLHSNKIEQSTFSFLFPLLRLKHQLLDSGYNIEFFQNLLKRKIFECDILFIESKYLKNVYSKDNSIFLETFFLKLRKKVNKIFFFDNSDSSSFLNYDVIDYVDLYFKSQILKDLNHYKRQIYGHRLYTQFYFKNYGIKDRQSDSSKKLKVKQIRKIKLSWNSGLSDYSFFAPTKKLFYNLFPIKLFLGNFKLDVEQVKQKKIDVNLRMNLDYDRKTISYHRNKMVDPFDLPKFKINRYRYFKELENSKIVLSPYGWGEINFRDYETFSTGALLVKPNMNHMHTWPDFFVNKKTYFGVDWHFEDIKQIVQNLLDNYDHFSNIAINGKQNYLKWKKTSYLEENFLQYFKNNIIPIKS